MLKRDPERLQRLRDAVRYLLANGNLEHGHQVRLAQYFSVTRQRVNQVVSEQEQQSGFLRPKRRVARDFHLRAWLGPAANSSEQPGGVLNTHARRLRSMRKSS